MRLPGELTVVLQERKRGTILCFCTDRSEGNSRWWPWWRWGSAHLCCLNWRTDCSQSGGWKRFFRATGSLARWGWLQNWVSDRPAGSDVITFYSSLSLHWATSLLLFFPHFQIQTCAWCHENSPATVVTMQLHTHTHSHIMLCRHLYAKCLCDWLRCLLAEAAALINLVLLKQSKCKLEHTLSLFLSLSLFLYLSMPGRL